ncbi:MAG: hypothetical protein NVS9B4_12840 [Candidatus Acidiferrum sp.]
MLRCLNLRAICALRTTEFLLTLALFTGTEPLVARTPNTAQNEKSQPGTAKNEKTAPPKQAATEKQQTPEQELQRTIDDAGNDRAALVRHLEAFLQKYPESPQRPQIYRALVEACVKLRDNRRAADYAERIIALNPSDMSMTILAVQLLERSGDEGGIRRAISYVTRVLEFVDRESSTNKSSKISEAQWQTDKKRDRLSVLLLRGRLYLKARNNLDALHDFEAAYALQPNADAAEKLGEIAELRNDPQRAIDEYAKAFALADGDGAAAKRRELRQKLGNNWRQAHGSDDGLGEYLLRSYDAVAPAPVSGARPVRNGSAHDPYDFTVRTVDGTPFPLAALRGKVLVMNFWATWCGPCRALEPQFDRVALHFQGNPQVLFAAVNCDEDETLVPAYLEEVKPRAKVLFSEGLDRFLAVNSFPTVMVIDRAGKIAYRSEGFGDEDFEQKLAAAARDALAEANSVAVGNAAH